MTPAEVLAAIGDVPHMTLKQGRAITEFIQKNAVKDIIELGFAHGVSTCYMAAALAEMGGGSITTIDLEWARHTQPNVEVLLNKIGHRGMVTCYYEPTSYVWRLMKLLEQQPPCRFDMCYLDGAHNWFVDGFAFFLVDRLLRPNGWIIFDDLYWTYAKSPTMANTERVRVMPKEEREIPQVLKIYELLVKTHPSYGDFLIQDGWAYAHKMNAEDAASVRTEVIVSKVPLRWAKLTRVIRRFGSRKHKQCDPNVDVTVPQ